MRKTTATILLMFASTQPVWAEGNAWDGEVELGVLVTTGDTEETNVNGRLGLVYEVERWRNTGEFASLYSQTDSETTAEEYRASLQSDYKFNDRQYWFLRGAYDDDRFSGYDYESSLTTGYGHRLWQQGERSFLDLTAGGGYRYNRLQEPDAGGEQYEKEAIVRLGGQLDYELSETSLFRQKLSAEIGVDGGNSLTESETSLQAAINSSLSMKVAYRVKHYSDPPANSASTNTETSLSLLYGF